MSQKIVIGFDGEFSGPFGKIVRTTNEEPLKTYLIAFAAYAMTVEKEPKFVDGFFVSLNPPESKGYGFDPATKKEFWDKPENNQLLKDFQRNTSDPDIGVMYFVKWMNDLIKRFGHENVIVCCDCPTDATWLDYYLTQYGYDPLITFFNNITEKHNSYTGWPIITDDQYRGYLRTSAGWGLDDKIKDICGYNPQPYSDLYHHQEHHPLYDAYGICSLFATFEAFK